MIFEILHTILTGSSRVCAHNIQKVVIWKILDTFRGWDFAYLKSGYD